MCRYRAIRLYFVSSRNSEDKLKVKQLLFDQIKATLSYYVETVSSEDADRLYFLKQHTLIEEMKFDENNESISLKDIENNYI